MKDTERTVESSEDVKQHLSKSIVSRIWRRTKWTLGYVVGRTIPQRIFRLYLIIVIIGACLLASPWCLQIRNGVQINGFIGTVLPDGTRYDFWDALFIACSGFSSTGLSTVSIYNFLNPFGQVVLMFLIEIGGMGVVAIFFVIWNSFKKKENIDVRHLVILQAERGGMKTSESFRIVKNAIIFILISQIFFAIMLSFCYCFIPAFQQVEAPVNKISWDDPTKPVACYGNYGYSLWVAMFSSVSAMNNAGFDIASADSLSPYRNDLGLIIQTIIAVELIIGGLGHVAIFDVIEKFRKRKTKQKHYFSLFTKMAVITYAIIAVFGIAGSLSSEFLSGMNDTETIIGNLNTNGEFGKNELLNKTACIIYNSIDSRCTGMASINPIVLTSGSKWFYIILMFIGGSPSSVAGGIRTTTFAVICLTIWNKILGRKQITVGKKTIPFDTVLNSFVISVVAVGLLMLGTFVVATSIPADTPRKEWLDITFEVLSAFGTVGLSIGIVSVAHWWGLLMLIFLMFVGQLGIINSLLSWTSHKVHKNDIQYSYEDVRIG